jgi:hypothetical protein
MSAPVLYYDVEQSSLNIDTGNRTTTTQAGGGTLAEVTALVDAAYAYIQAGSASETRSMAVKLNAAVVAVPPETPTPR